MCLYMVCFCASEFLCVFWAVRRSMYSSWVDTVAPMWPYKTGALYVPMEFELAPCSLAVLGRLKATVALRWRLAVYDGALLMIDARNTCYFQALDGQTFPTKTGVCELALTEHGRLMVRFPFGCVVFDGRVRTWGEVI